MTNIHGDSEPLTQFRNLSRTRSVNGEKSLTFFALPNDVAYPLIETESTVRFDGEDYVIRQVNETNSGKRSVKKVEAVHRFFIDMLDAFQYETHTGSQTFQAALTRVFGPTPYGFTVVGSGFYAERFENFGRDNCLALFKNVLERYDAEFRVNSRTVTLYRRYGANTDFQFRYAHNVKAIDFQQDTHDLATVIRGFGGEEREDGTFPIQRTYTSPNIEKFGRREAPAVYNENITTVEGMDARLRRDLIDEPQLSITIDFADLRAAGYTANVPNEGDWGFIIYEPMDLKLEARIVEVQTEYDVRLKPMRTQVTLSNIKRKLSDTMTQFSQTSKTLGKILAGQQKVPYGALVDAVQIATEALLSAQTELKFENGILAIDKRNANNVVLFNSAGLGISTDGGRTFENAITAHGVVAEAITAGAITQGGIRSVVISDGYVFSLNGDDLTTSFGQYGLEFFALNGDRAGTLYPSRSISNPNLRGVTLTMEPNAYYSVAYQQGQHRYQSFDTSQETGQTIVAGAVRTQQQGSRLSMFANAAMIGADRGNSIFGSRVTDQAHMQLIQTSSRNNVQIGFGGYTNRNDSVFELVHNLNATQVTVMMRAENNGVTFPSYSTFFGQRQVRISPVSNGVQWTAGNGNYIYQHESNGQVEIYMGGRMVHAFKADGTKQGGSIDIDGELLGMSPVDSPQFLIEYVLFDAEATPGGTTHLLDDGFLKAVNGRYYVDAMGAGVTVSKGAGSITLFAEEPTKMDVKVGGERYDKVGAFWQRREDWQADDVVLGPANIDVSHADVADESETITDQEVYYEERETGRVEPKDLRRNGSADR